MVEKVVKSPEEWKVQLSEEQFAVCRLAATERPFSGKYYTNKAAGTYHCACCGEALFSSETKYDSGSGWPSFYKPASQEAIAEKRDSSHGMVRVEILCAKCDSHLGHVFDDGPRPTGLRYCVNSLSLDFQESD